VRKGDLLQPMYARKLIVKGKIVLFGQLGSNLKM